MGPAKGLVEVLGTLGHSDVSNGVSGGDGGRSMEKKKDLRLGV